MIGITEKDQIGTIISREVEAEIDTPTIRDMIEVEAGIGTIIIGEEMIIIQVDIIILTEDGMIVVKEENIENTNKMYGILLIKKII